MRQRRANTVYALIVMSLFVAASVAASGQTRLSDDSRRLLESVRAKGSTIAKLMLVTDPKQTSAVAARLRDVGGEIRLEEDRVGYVRVIVPMSKVDAVAHIRGVQVVEPYYREGVEFAASIIKSEEASQKKIEERIEAAAMVKLPVDVPQPPVPYVTQDLMGINRLLKVNPKFDGRGVVVAIVDGGTPQLTHPELQWAFTLDGRRVSKILDVIPTSMPQDENDPWWIDMRASAEARGGVIVFQGKSYRTPRAGTFRIGILSDELAGKLAANVHALKTAPDPHFAVLWDPESGTVWVDTNQDQDFTDETALTDFSKGHQVGLIGAAEGALDQKVAFAVYTAPQWNAVHLSFGEAAHPTMCASTAAGNNEAGGLFNGVAPNAQIIVYDGIGGTLYNTEYVYTEALIRAVSDPRVDIVSVSLGIVGNIPSIVIARLSSLYDKPISYAGLIGTLPPVFTTAMYMDRETLRRNLGITGEREEFVVGERFTLPDGRLVPDVLGPVNSLAANSALLPFRKPNTEWLHLPPGYMIGGGASQSTPMFAGLLADVISAARQTRTPVDLARLTAAVRTGSRWIREVPGSNKSAPLPQADQVWNALRKLARRPPSRIEVAAPIKSFARSTSDGLGVVDEHGSVNAERAYRISLTRHSGPARAVTYDLRWLGNDATFRAPERVTLPKGRAATIETHAIPRSVGTMTAVLEVIDRSSGNVVQQVPHSVTVPLDFAASSPQPLTEKLTIEQHGQRTLAIPSRSEGTLEVEIASADAELTCWILSPSRQWVIADRTGAHGAVVPQLRTQPQWQELADVSSLGLSAGYGYRVMLTPDVPGVWQLSLRRRAQPDIELPHTHTPEDMKAIPVIVTVRQLAND